MNIIEKIDEAKEKLEMLADIGYTEGFLASDEIETLNEAGKVFQEAKEEIRKAYDMEK
jgi:hypothetical protein